MATIQWFPGHMSKARRQVQENLKFVYFVTVLVDARLPLSSQNPMLTKIVGDKPKLMILNKVDLADLWQQKNGRTILSLKALKPWLSTPKSNLRLRRSQMLLSL